MRLIPMGKMRSTRYWFLVLWMAVACGASGAVGAQGLEVDLSAATNVVANGDMVVLTATISNSGSTPLTDITYEIERPDYISSSAGATLQYTLGDLDPGQSKTGFFPVTFNETGPVTTGAMLTVFVNEVLDGTSAIEFALIEAPLLRLRLAPDSGPAEPGDAFGYTLVYGNVGLGNPTNTILSMRIPDGTEFLSANGGGLESAGVVTWNLGLVTPRLGGQLRVELQVDKDLGDGKQLVATAEIDSNLGGEPIVEAKSTTPVRSEEPLVLKYSVSETVLAPGAEVIYTVTATNISTYRELLDITAKILLPEYMTSFRDSWSGPGLDCYNGYQGYTCEAGDFADWNVGTLGPGESRVFTFETTVAQDALPGGISRSQVRTTSADGSQSLAFQDVSIDGSHVFRLAVSPDPGPGRPGEYFGYTIRYANNSADGRNPTDTELTVVLPENSSFVSASEDGEENEGVVTWDLGLVLPGRGGGGLSDS